MMKRLKQAKPVAIILSFAVLLSLLAGWQAKYRNRVFPGVSVAGIEAEGMDKNEVEKILQEKYKKMQTLKLVSGTNHWVIWAGDIDLKFFPAETPELALTTGLNATRWHLSGADSQPIELPITLPGPKLTAKQTENPRQRALRLLGKKIKVELEETS